jgi:hypothetical protein
MSTLRVNTLQDVAGTGQPAMVGAAKAWVNFNGTGTVAIRAQYNVSSITDNGTGDYTVNFTTAMTDANYVCVGSIGRTADATFGVFSGPRVSSPTNSGIRVTTTTSAPNLTDYDWVHVTIFR